MKDLDFREVCKKLQAACKKDLPKTAQIIFGDTLKALLKDDDLPGICRLVQAAGEMFEFEWMKPMKALLLEAIEKAKAMNEVVYYSILNLLMYEMFDEEEFKDNIFTSPESLDVDFDDYKWMATGYGEGKSDTPMAIPCNSLLSYVSIRANDYDVMADYYVVQNKVEGAAYAKTEICVEQLNHAYRYDIRKKCKEELWDILAYAENDPVSCFVVYMAYKHSCLDISSKHSIADENKEIEQKQSIVNKYLNAYPTGKYTHYLDECVRDMNRAMVKMDYCSESHNTVSPEEDFVIPIEHRNIACLTAKLLSTTLENRDCWQFYSGMGYYVEDMSDKVMTYVNSYEPVWEHQYVTLPEKSLYWQELHIHIPAQRPGIYLLVIETDNGVKRMNLLHVSNLMAISFTLPNNGLQITVVNKTSGAPVPYAKLAIYTPHKKKWRTKRCNHKGIAIIHQRCYCDIYPYTKEDRVALYTEASISYSYKKERKSTIVAITTDRSAYRPGQTIHAAAFCFQEHKDKSIRIKPNHRFEFTLAAERYGPNLYVGKCKADRNGVAFIDIHIPQEAELGDYEFKQKHDSLDCYITVADYKLPTFEVSFDKYTNAYEPGQTITLTGRAMGFNGSPITSAEIYFKLFTRDCLWWWWWRQHNYYCTDSIEWESQMKSCGELWSTTDESGCFQVDVPLTLNDRDDQIPTFVDFMVVADVTDLNGETRTGCLTLPLSNRKQWVSLQMRNQFTTAEPLTFTPIVKNNAGEDIDCDVTYSINEGEEYVVTSNRECTIKNLTPGKYTITIHTLGETPCNKDVVIFDPAGISAPYETEKWTWNSGDTFSTDGTPVRVQVGCSTPDTYIHYAIFSGNRKLASDCVKCKTGMLNFPFVYKKAYGNGIQVTFAWFAGNEMQEYSHFIGKPLPSYDLDVQWDTFRKISEPGAEEEWSVKVQDKDGTPVEAQMVAAVYNKALEELANHAWEPFIITSSWNEPNSTWDKEIKSTINLTCEEEKIFDFKIRYAPKLGCISRLYINSPTTWLADLKPDKSIEIPPICNDEAGDLSCDNPPSSLRTHFAETAYWNPCLRTDEQGHVKLVFTLPDTLTTWKMRGLAFSNQVKWGFIEGEVVARKRVMVAPNVPRFVRAGDACHIPVKVINQGQKEIEGVVKMILRDKATNRLEETQEQACPVEAGGQKAVTLQFVPSQEIKTYVCQVFFIGGGFSDGEQHELPVLSNQMDLTLTRAFDLNEAKAYQFAVQDLFPKDSTLRQARFSYTHNVAWMAVKALTAIREAAPENAVSVAATYYCTRLTQDILAQLKEGGADPQTLPPMPTDTEGLLARLEKLQRADGAFSWFAKMPSSLRLTATITVLLARLWKYDTAPVVENELRVILTKAMDYLAASLHADRVDMRYTSLQYHYCCALVGKKLSAKERRNVDYLIPLLLKDIRKQTIDEKAMTAIILDYVGLHQEAKDYAMSLRQYLTEDKDCGLYFQTQRAAYSWVSYKIPTHVMALEALAWLCPDDKETLYGMQKWLLWEKRSQTWDTPIDSVNAVHALLYQAHDLFAPHAPAEFFADGIKLEVPPRNCIEQVLVADTHTLEIVKHSEAISWGAVFADFCQAIAKVQDQACGMHIRREIIPSSPELHVGDRIKVVLTYTCDRDYDMVQVLDAKAACMEPVTQLAWSDSFKHVSPRDTCTEYYYHGLAKGQHSHVTEFVLDRPGTYALGTAQIKCLYAPEFNALCASEKITVLP